MDARELRTIIDGIAEKLPGALLDNKGVEATMYAISKIASYLESEQDKRERLDRQMTEHSQMMKEHTARMEQFDKAMWGDRDDLEKNPGFANEMVLARKQSKRNEKFLIVVLAGVATAIILSFLQFIGVHLK